MSTNESVDVVVIGGGAMGSAAAWQLSKRGREVVLLERFAPGHKEGASHGASRNLNLSYSDPNYLALLQRAVPLWAELEQETGTSVFDQVGVVTHGAHPSLTGVRDALEAHSFTAEILSPEAAGERWDGLRFETDVLWTPQAGRLNADASVAAMQRAAAARGSDIRHGVRVESIRVVDENQVIVTLEDGNTITASSAVVAAGAWTRALLTEIVELPALVVTQEQPAHFQLVDASLGDAFVTDWPGFNHLPGDGDEWWYSNIYGMFTPGEGIKAGWHGVGPVVDPDHRDYQAEPKQLEALVRYVREWIPAANADTASAVSCTYTTTQDENFVLDRVGPLTIAAGFSGHGYKFTTAVGEVLAELVTGVRAPDPFFSLTRDRGTVGRPGSSLWTVDR